MARDGERLTPCRHASSIAKGTVGHLLGALPVSEAGNFWTCHACGHLVDRRRLGEVLHHDILGHKPIPRNEQTWPTTPA
jgi:hypothetical protein